MKNVYLAPFYWFYYSWESFGVGCSRWKVQDVCGQRAKEYLWSFLNKSFFRYQILLYRLIGSFWQLLSPVHRYWCWWDVWLWQGPKVCCYSNTDSKLFENKLKVFLQVDFFREEQKDCLEDLVTPDRLAEGFIFLPLTLLSQFLTDFKLFLLREHLGYSS